MFVIRERLYAHPVERKEHEANHLAPFDVEVQITSTFTSTLSSAFLTCTWATSSLHLCKLQSCSGHIWFKTKVNSRTLHMVYLHEIYKNRERVHTKPNAWFMWLPIIHDKQTTRLLKQQMLRVNRGLTRF